MDYRRINSHIVLLGMLIVVGLFAAIIVRMSMLESEADSGTANLIFVLMQYSVYNRYCASRESMEVHIRRVRGLIPSSGQVSILSITDKQYGDIINYWGKIERAKPQTPQQLEFF